MGIYRNGKTGDKPTMPRRIADKVLFTSVSEDERRLIDGLAKREGCAVSELLRRGINSLALDVGDEAVFLESRRPGRRRLSEND